MENAHLCVTMCEVLSRNVFVRENGKGKVYTLDMGLPPHGKY